MPSSLTGASGREHVVHPIEVSWHFSDYADFIDDYKYVILIVGRVEGDDFIPMDMRYINEQGIRPYFAKWGSGEHATANAGATHFVTISADPLDSNDIRKDLRAAYPGL